MGYDEFLIKAGEYYQTFNSLYGILRNFTEKIELEKSETFNSLYGIQGY